MKKPRQNDARPNIDNTQVEGEDAQVQDICRGKTLNWSYHFPRYYLSNVNGEN